MKMEQITNTVLMVRPVNFRMNEETAVNNYFQEDLQLKNEEIKVNGLKARKINGGLCQEILIIYD